MMTTMTEKLAVAIVQAPREGTVQLPLLPATLPFLNLTEAEAIAAVQFAYRQANLMPMAQVTVLRISADEAAVGK